jgi:hypothetical protein
MKTTALIFLLGFSVLAVGCGPSKAEREAAERERQRLELEEKTRREERAAHEAISEMNKKNFGKLTPEERAAREAERDRYVQQLREEREKREAEHEASKAAETK